MDGPKTVITCAVLTLSSIIGVWLYRRSKREKIPTEWKAVGNVSDLCIYPLKSGHRMEVKEAECTTYGLKQITDKAIYKLRDRCFVVYDESKNNEIKTGRSLPKMVLIEVSNHDADHIALDAPGMRTLYTKIPDINDKNVAKCRVFEKEVELIDCGGEAAAWLSRYLTPEETGLRLGFHTEEMESNLVERKLLKFYPNIENNDLGMFSDLTSYMLMSKTSMDDLNSRLTKEATCLQFRPCIIVENIEEPYAEDSWEWIKIGNEATFRNIKPCTRCVFTTVDIETGIRDPDYEPLKTLRTYRQLKDPEQNKAENHAPVLGANLGLRKYGVIKVGDVVYAGKN